MSSFKTGKDEVIDWIKNNFKETDCCLDVGACDGMYAWLLDGYFDKIDGVEIFEPNIVNNHLKALYDNVYCADIKDFKYDYYDLIIFGDVIEHMSIEDAQKTLEYAKTRCKDMIVAVPYLLIQDEVFDNPYEVHIQNDITPGIFHERYNGFEPLFIYQEYGYYHLRPKEMQKSIPRGYAKYNEIKEENNNKYFNI